MLKKLLMLFALIALVFPSKSYAKVIVEEKGVYELKKGEVVDDDLFVGAESVTIDGTVNGNVYVGASSLKMHGTVNGDLIGGVGAAELSGTVKGDTYLGAGSVMLDALKVGGTLALGGGNLRLDEQSSVGGSLLAGAGTIISRAAVARSAMIGAGSIELDGQVGKEARLAGSQIRLGDNAKIMGDVTYALGDANATFSQAESASVSGTVTKYEQPAAARRDMARAQEDMRRFGQVVGHGWMLLSFIGALIIGGICLALFRRTFAQLGETLASTFGKSLGIGTLIAVLAFPVFLVLLVSIVGIPLLPIVIPLFFLDLYFAKLVAAYALGVKITTLLNLSHLAIFWHYALGLTILYLLRLVPGIGWLAGTLATLSGLGAIWLTIQSSRKQL